MCRLLWLCLLREKMGIVMSMRGLMERPTIAMSSCLIVTIRDFWLVKTFLYTERVAITARGFSENDISCPVHWISRLKNPMLLYKKLLPYILLQQIKRRYVPLLPSLLLQNDLIYFIPVLQSHSRISRAGLLILGMKGVLDIIMP